MAVWGLRFCARAFSSCGKWGPLFTAVRGPLSIVASLVAEHRLQTRRLSNCGSRALLPRGMWDLPRPGLQPVAPALAGRFSTTAPPGKPFFNFLNMFFTHSLNSYNSCVKVFAKFNLWAALELLSIMCFSVFFSPWVWVIFSLYLQALWFLYYVLNVVNVTS